jgi:hypothetical protein
MAPTSVRAFEPRYSHDDGLFHCRGRRAKDGGGTRQCGQPIRVTSQRFCGYCGGLIAWGGIAFYDGRVLRHLERMDLSGTAV